MLKQSKTADSAVDFAVDLIGLATRYDFTVVRWGLAGGEYKCVATRNFCTFHDDWIAADIELANQEQADAFLTDCMIAGLYGKRVDSIIHIQTQPYMVVVQ